MYAKACSTRGASQQIHDYSYCEFRRDWAEERIEDSASVSVRASTAQAEGVL